MDAVPLDGRHGLCGKDAAAIRPANVFFLVLHERLHLVEAHRIDERLVDICPDGILRNGVIGAEFQERFRLETVAGTPDAEACIRGSLKTLDHLQILRMVDEDLILDFWQRNILYEIFLVIFFVLHTAFPPCAMCSRAKKRDGSPASLVKCPSASRMPSSCRRCANSRIGFLPVRRRSAATS